MTIQIQKQQIDLSSIDVASTFYPRITLLEDGKRDFGNGNVVYLHISNEVYVELQTKLLKNIVNLRSFGGSESELTQFCDYENPNLLPQFPSTFEVALLLPVEITETLTIHSNGVEQDIESGYVYFITHESGGEEEATVTYSGGASKFLVVFIDREDILI